MAQGLVVADAAADKAHHVGEVDSLRNGVVVCVEEVGNVADIARDVGDGLDDMAVADRKSDGRRNWVEAVDKIAVVGDDRMAVVVVEGVGYVARRRQIVGLQSS